MAIRAGCANCGATLKAEDRHAGRTVPCPKCQSPVTLQAESPSNEPIDPFAEDADALLSPPPPPAPRRSKPKPKPQSPDQVCAPSARKTEPDQDPAPSRPASLPEDSFADDASEPPADDSLDDSFPDLTEEELAGQAISPRKKKRKRPAEDLETRKARRAVSSNSSRSGRCSNFRLANPSALAAAAGPAPARDLCCQGRWSKLRRTRGGIAAESSRSQRSRIGRSRFAARPWRCCFRTIDWTGPFSRQIPICTGCLL